MDKKHEAADLAFLPAAYLVVVCAGVNLFVPVEPWGVFIAAVLVGVVWTAVSGGLLLRRLRRQRRAGSIPSGPC